MAHIAQEILVEYIKKNEEKLYRIAYTYTKNQENALDVVQEAITKSLENISKLRNEEYVKTWFYRILINEAIKASKNTKSFIDYETITNELSSQSNENELIENIDTFAIIQKLKPKLKTVIILRFFENLKIEEIAYITKTNTNTVKSRLYKAIEDIRKDLEERELPGETGEGKTGDFDEKAADVFSTKQRICLICTINCRKFPCFQNDRIPSKKYRISHEEAKK